MGGTMDPQPVTGFAMPNRIAKLPRNQAGYPVPWFVAAAEGEPDFRIIEPEKIERSILKEKCWVCGDRRTGPTAAFVIGPMCAINRVSAEPPSHRECAVYSAQVCPFLVNPKKRRRQGGLEDIPHYELEGFIDRNPGVTLVWVARNGSWKPFSAKSGVYFDIGEPVRTMWFTEGREATRDEVLASIESGLPLLQEAAAKEGDLALAALAQMVKVAMPLVPA